MKRAWHQKFARAAKERRTDVDGTVFSSIAEMNRWKKLQLWQLAGEIRNLRRQVKYPLKGNGIEILTDTGKVMTYTADFVYDRKGDLAKLPAPPLTAIFYEADGYRPWVEVIEDFKGYKGPVEKMRIAVFEAIYKVKVNIVRR